MAAATPLFFDANATTPCCDEAVAALLPLLQTHFGNVSSSHALSRAPAAALASARASVGALVGAAAADVVFCSCATESINTLVAGLHALHPRGHAVAGATEHVAVLAALECARKRGARVTLVQPAADGSIPPDALAAALEPDTFLVTCMLANNETGAVTRVAAAAAAVRARAAALGASAPFFHCDASQAIGKLRVDVRGLGVDALTLAGHKLYAPKGIGATVFAGAAARGAAGPPLLVGGGQECGARAGTENVALAAALGAAARVAAAALDAGAPAATARLRGRLATAVRAAAAAAGVPVALHGPLRAAFAAGDAAALGADDARALPNTLSLGFAGARASRVVAALADTLAVSAGSACHAGDGEHASHVLAAMGADAAEARGTVRVSLARGATEADVDAAARLLVAAVAAARDA